ncbi:MAG: MFS transporter [Nonomuraea sp.]|nr:MFS transporter [Nonomuraea sp.]
MNPRRWWILGVLCLTLLVLSVDDMILNLAIPALMRDLGASPADVQWILDAYILVFAGSLITAGSLSDRYGRRRLLLIGLVILGTASLLGALSEEPWELVVCRALMGLGAAMAMPSTLSILINVFEEGERRTAMAAWSVVGMVGVVAGPTLGGLLLQHFWWGSAFLINVPLAAVGLVATLAVVPESRGPARPADPLGVVLSIAGMGALIWAIISLPHTGLSGPVAASLVVAVLALGGFVLWESRSANPMLPLGMFRDRNFTGASLSVVLLSFATGALLLALTQYLQFVLAYGPLRAGLALAPLAVTAIVFNFVGAKLGTKVSNRALLVVGLLVVALGFGVFALVDGYPMVMAGLAVMGVGSGLGGPAAYAMLMGAIPPEHAGVGSAVSDTVQQAGLAIGIAGLGSALTAAYSASLPDAVPAGARVSIEATLRLGIPELAEAGRQAFVSAMSLVSVAGIVLSLAGAAFALVVLRATEVGRT